MLQVRPRFRDPRVRDPMYAPHRDIAYIGPQLMIEAAARAMDPTTWAPWFKAFMEHYGISLETLNEAAMRLMEAFGDISSLRCSFDEALRRSGFDSMPAAVQAAFYVNMGKILLAAMHRGIGDIVDYDGTPPPHVQDMCEQIIAQARKISRSV